MRLHWVIRDNGRRLHIPFSQFLLALRVHQAAVNFYVDGKDGHTDPPLMYPSLRKRP